MKTKETIETVERVIGLDAHPDSFTAAILRGPTPRAALVEKTFDQVPMGRLASWAQKHTTEQDLIVLEASGNSFTVVRVLASVGRSAKVLESYQMGKLKEAHANNDKISAVRIGQAYLAGTAKEVWVPDAQTQERRDWFHAHRKATARLTQLRARLRSYLSDNGVRLPAAFRLTDLEEATARLRQTRDWSPRQWPVIENLLLELSQADQQRRQWRSLIAQEVLDDPDLLALVRLCGVREMIAFALGAFIGKIDRFAHPKSLVNYVGLNPAFDDSGQGTWSGGVGGHGNKWLRTLLMEGAQAILRSTHSRLAQWGKKLMARKGQRNLAVAAVARKLTVSVWYLMKGRWTPLEEIDARLSLKVGKIISQVKPEALRERKQTPQSVRERACQSLKSRRVETPVAPQAKASAVAPKAPTKPQPQAKMYVLDPDKKLTSKAQTAPVAV